MLLYANGCSMTYGSELDEGTDTRAPRGEAYREDHAWPARLGELLGFEEVVNDAVPAGSNDRVLRRTTAWLLGRLSDRGSTDVFVVIGWSGAMRREFYVDGEWRQMIPYHRYDHPDHDRLTLLYKDIAWHAQECGERLATQILSLQSLLQRYAIPYLFFDAIESSRASIVAADPATRAHLGAIDTSRFHGFEDPGDASMAAYCSAEAALWMDRHPSEPGHARWASELAGAVMSAQLLHPPRETAPRRPPAPPQPSRPLKRRRFVYP